MSNWPLNAEVLQGIARTSFYNTVSLMESDRIYSKICKIIPQQDLSVTYTSFGEVPEPRQLSGSRASSGQRQARGLKDYKMTGTVVEWEQTVEVPRSVIETNPASIPDVTARMARKAMLFMDRRLVGTILGASTAGYDGVSLYNDAHPESGTNQDNNFTTAAATGTKPTAAELESALDAEIGAIKGFTDDRLTPVNEGVENYTILCPIAFEYLYKSVLNPGINAGIAGYDSSASSITTSFGAGSGRFRGMVNVVASAFVSANDRHYLFANGTGSASVALLKNKDFEFVTNIGTDSDTWRHAQMAVFSSYARFEFIPWDWKTTCIEVWT